MKVTKLIRSTALLAGGLLIFATAGCTSEPVETDGPELTEILVAIPPSLNQVALPLAVEKGIFREAGLDVEILGVENGAAGTAALMNGQVQFAATGSLPQITAVSRGLPMKIIAGITVISPGTGDLTVTADSTIKTAADLEGMTVAVPAIGSLDHVTMMAEVEHLGADPAKVNFLPLGLDKQLQALESGDVDAAVLSEPYLSAAIQDGFVALSTPAMTVLPSPATGSSWYATAQTVTENPELVRRFHAAVAKAAEFANENPDEVRAFLPSYLPVSAEVAERVKIIEFSADVNIESLVALAEIAQKFGIMEQVPDIVPVVWQP